jgi:hypothetical protein
MKLTIKINHHLLTQEDLNSVKVSPTEDGIFVFVLVVLGLQPRASFMLRKHSTPAPSHPIPSLGGITSVSSVLIFGSSQLPYPKSLLVFSQHLSSFPLFLLLVLCSEVLFF